MTTDLQRAADSAQAKARATGSRKCKATARRLQARADLHRKADKRLSRWYRDNPGWHFLADACDGMGIPSGKASSQPYSAAAKRLTERGVLERTGAQHTTRYRYKGVDST